MDSKRDVPATPTPSVAEEASFGDLTPPPPLPSAFAATAGPRKLAVTDADAGPLTGRYTFQHLHATGGIGRVWLTRDATLGREVALKELRPETAHDSRICARFLEEARITGQLEHPGIVPVYELAWRDGAGQPFYTMRFVKGRTLSQAIRDYHQKRQSGAAEPLDLRALLNAFGAICNTLAYAHARGVIHRDLKGQNVLLGDFGEVIVLDWGLAKLLDRPETPADLPAVLLEPDADRDATLQGMVLGTPAYMAPEQAAGDLDQIDARTDVYGLGAILYEILTGQPPFRGLDTNDLLRKVREEVPERPSKLMPAAPRALEAVCLKALARVPAERYDSAAELAGDIQRYLADEPVSACREPWRVRAGRWGRRHKTLVSGVGVLLCTTVVALAISTVLIGRQKARAEENFQMARDAVERFHVRVSEELLLQEPGLQPLRKSLLETARKFFQRFVDENAHDSGRRADLGTTLVKLGRITAEIGDTSQAIELLLRAEGILETDPSLRHELATCRNVLGVCYRSVGRLADAEQAFLRAIAAVPQPAHAPDWRFTLARSHNNLGLVLRDRSQYARAAAAHREAVGLQHQLVEEFPDKPRYRNELGGSFNNLAGLFSALGKPAEAAVELYRAKDLWSQDSAGTPSSERNENLALGHYNLAVLHTRYTRPLLAWDHAQLAAHLYHGLTAANPTVTRYRHKLARAQLKLGEVLVQFWEQARPADEVAYLAAARASYGDAQSHLERLVREHGQVAAFRLDQAQACISQGNLCGWTKERGAALEWYRLGLIYLDQIGQEFTANADMRQAQMMAHWGKADILAQLERHAESLPDWDRAVSFAEGRQRALVRLGRANSLVRLGDYTRAAEEANLTAAAHPEQVGMLIDLARILARAAEVALRDEQKSALDGQGLSQRRADEALTLLERAAKAGVFNHAGNREQLLTAKELDVLRKREDFQRLLTGK